jgi:HlyD family secretion protein
VKRGQVIARIDPALFEARVAQTRAALKQAQAEVAKAQANLEQATLDFRRYQELWRQNLVARNDLDKARTTYEASQAELHAAQARVSQNAAALKDAETNLAYATIISPVDGVVVSRSVDVGQTVASSFQTPTLFTIAQDLTRMQVETSVDEAEVGKVTEGQSVTFTVDAHPETTFTGQVNQVRLAPTTVQNVVTYTVVIQAGNPQLLLKPGMTATVRILVARQENVLAVPNAALRFHPKGVKDAPPPTAGPAVWRLGPQRQPQAVPVKLGITDGVWTEIKEGAVKEGDRLIIGRKETGAPTGTGYMRGPV